VLGPLVVDHLVGPWGYLFNVRVVFDRRVLAFRVGRWNVSSLGFACSFSSRHVHPMSFYREQHRRQPRWSRGLVRRVWTKVASTANPRRRVPDIFILARVLRVHCGRQQCVWLRLAKQHEPNNYHPFDRNAHTPSCGRNQPNRILTITAHDSWSRKEGWWQHPGAVPGDG
jgi:hypothetical protein